ncbi:MAG: hypothetical protein J5842_04640 [Lachnospiraceae bacterium]|nr:hypothetical protein [Lachnospiraceae bacterium]
MNEKHKKIINEYIFLIYPLFTLIYFAYVFFSSIRTGITMTFFLAVGTVGICALYLTFETVEDKIFGLYVIFNLVSGVWCVLYGIPLSVFIGEISTTLLPMFLYYAGRGFKEEEDAKYYHGFMFAALLMGAIGAVFYVWAPQFYIDFSYVNEFISKADAPTMRVRMNSIIGSGPMGAFVAYSTCVSAYFLRKDDKKNRITGFVYLFLSILFSFMANQRSAMFCVIMFLIFYELVDVLVDKRKPVKYLWIAVGAAAALLLGIFIFAREIFDKFYIRLASIPDGFGERTGSWFDALHSMKNIWIGDGLGSHGHRAAEVQLYIVADGGLVKLYTEMGIIGTAMIVSVLVIVYLKSLTRDDKKAAEGICSGRKISLVVPELAVITSAILMSIGSNVLEMELCAPIVYFALGRAVKKLNDTKPAPDHKNL